MIVGAKEKMLFSRAYKKDNEVRIETSTVRDRVTGIERKLVDIRKWWFRDGADHPSVPTRTGLSMPRKWMVQIALSLLGDLSPSELTEADAAGLDEVYSKLRCGEDG